MKTRIIIVAIVSAAILFVGASKIGKSTSMSNSSTQISSGTVGGLASDDK